MDILQQLEQANAVYLDRHFVYKSGKHGSGYINMDPLFANIRLMTSLCADLIEPYKDRVRIDTIAAPATGGIVLSVLVARSALSRYPALKAPACIWADKVGDDFRFERAGFNDHLRGKRVLVVEDLLTTGGSVIKVCREAEKQDAEIVGVSAIVNRGGVTAEQLGVPRLECLAKVNFAAVDADQCESCAKHVPIVEDIGHGAAHKKENPEYPGGYIKLLG